MDDRTTAKEPAEAGAKAGDGAAQARGAWAKVWDAPIRLFH